MSKGIYGISFATYSTQVIGKDCAQAIVFRLIQEGHWVACESFLGDLFQITVEEDKKSILLGIKPRLAFVFVQEGASTGEYCLHAHEVESEAHDDRVSCASAGSYNTGPVHTISALLNEIGQPFYVVAEALVQSTAKLELKESA